MALSGACGLFVSKLAQYNCTVRVPKYAKFHSVCLFACRARALKVVLDSGKGENSDEKYKNLKIDET